MTDNYWVEGQVYVASEIIDLDDANGGGYINIGDELLLTAIQYTNRFLFKRHGITGYLTTESSEYIEYLKLRTFKKQPYVAVDCGTLFHELSKKKVQELFDAYLSSKIIQEKNPNADSTQWFDMDFNDRICFDMNCYYQIKPEIR